MQNYNSKFKIFTFYIVILIFTFLFLHFAPVAQAALVPCGTSTTPPCTWCHLGQLVKNIIDFMMYIIFPLSAVMIVTGGIMVMTAGGSTSRVAKGRGIVTAAIVGLLIALLSWLIIDTIIKIIAVGWNGLQIGPWYKLSC